MQYGKWKHRQRSLHDCHPAATNRTATSHDLIAVSVNAPTIHHFLLVMQLLLKKRKTCLFYIEYKCGLGVWDTSERKNTWNRGLITPSFKRQIRSVWAVMFCSIIINTKLVHFLTEHNALSKSQIGFLPNFRTSVHFFTLHTLIDKYINQNKDFQKAFFLNF